MYTITTNLQISLNKNIQVLTYVKYLLKKTKLYAVFMFCFRVLKVYTIHPMWVYEIEKSNKAV